MSDFDIKIFKKRLAETIAWCKPRFSMDDLEHCLRTNPQPPHGAYPEMPILSEFADIVFDKREIEADDDLILYQYRGLHGGRLLVIDLLSTTCMGTSKVETKGFIDDCDLSAWDTWVYCSPEKGVLVCWIPREMIETVQYAILASAEQCLAWIEDSEPYGVYFLEELKQAGLLFEDEK